MLLSGTCVNMHSAHNSVNETSFLVAQSSNKGSRSALIFTTVVEGNEINMTSKSISTREVKK